jgi:hypothetical protein
MGINEKQQYSVKGVKGMVQPVYSIGVGGCIIYHGSFLMYAMTETVGGGRVVEEESG